MPRARPIRSDNRQTGLSMIELMIALTISLFLLIGLVSVFATSNRTYLEINRAGQQIENGRFAVQLLSDDIALAGYYGRWGALLAAPGSLPDPCAIDAASLRAGTALPLQGYNAPSSPPAPLSSCISAANHVTGTDILVVRRADTLSLEVDTGSASQPPKTTGCTTPAPVGTACPIETNEMYIQTNSNTTDSNPMVNTGTVANFALKNRDITTLAPVRKYRVHVYFIAPCSVPNGGGTVCTGAADDNGSPIPTLKRLELMVDPSDNTLKLLLRPLVEGIENFQVDYGVDADGDGVPDSPTYATSISTIEDWQNVVSVRINLLARNLRASPDYTDTKTYDLGAAGTVAPGGNFKRHVYNAVIRIVNIAGRRES